MSLQICNKRGISLVEVVISMFLITVGVLAILSLQPSAWRAVGKSDYLGRAAGILQKELDIHEAFIMNPCNNPNNLCDGSDTVPCDTAPADIFVSGQGAAVSGDATYTVTTTITSVATNVWRVQVNVQWADQQRRNYRDLDDSITVTRQEGFRFPAGCT